MTASKLSQGLIEFDVDIIARIWNFRLLKSVRANRAATCSSCFATLSYSFSLKRSLAGRSLCRFRAERRKVAHGFSTRFARQKNLLSSPAAREKSSEKGQFLRRRVTPSETDVPRRTRRRRYSMSSLKQKKRLRPNSSRCPTRTRNGIPSCIHMYHGRRKTRCFLSRSQTFRI